MARERFRLFVIMYLLYPAVILTLLAVIGAGAYAYYTRDMIVADLKPSPEPEWCYASLGTPQSPYYPSAAQPPGGFEPAIPSSTYGPAPFNPDLFGGFNRATRIGADQVAYYVSESIKAADGVPDARFRRDSVGLSPVQMGVARKRFIDRSRLDGKLGFYRLGLVQLGDDAFPIAQSWGLKVPFCRPNNFVTADKSEAFFNFAVAKACDTARATRAADWLQAIAQYEGYPADKAGSIEMDARNYVIGDPQVCLSTVADTTPTPGIGPGDPNDPEPELGPVPSEQQQQQPSAAPDQTGATGVEGNRRNERELARGSRQALNLGDAALAGGDLKAAREFWLQAIDYGKLVGAQTALTAQKRLQTRTLTCNFTRESLKAISRDYEARKGDLVQVKVIQQALRALGHYEGPISGKAGPATRAAIRKFQREMEFDETDALSPLQTVYLICNAAETARDLGSQNALGIMYAAGLGVEQNVDLALEWLRAASNRGYANSTFNLALLYGSGIVLNSYRLCDMPRSPEQADQYLREAAGRGHSRAIALLQRFGGLDVRKRWEEIEKAEMKENPGDKNGVYEGRLAEDKIEAKCKPGRNVR